MKRIILFTFALLTSNMFFGQWNNYNVITEYTELSDVCFTDPINGWIVGEKEGLVVYHTSDGGNTLEIQYENSNSGAGYPSSVCFVNSSSGWVAADGIILHTADGGNTWVQQAGGIALGGGGISVFFIDENKGWVAGSHTILKTEDGGETWQSQEFPSGSLYNIHFTDADHGWSVGWSGYSDGILLRTIDGGISWSQTITIGTRWEDIYFISQDEGWMIGQEQQAGYNFDPRIYHSVDGGINWNLQFAESFATSWDMNILFTDPMHGWASYGMGSSGSNSKMLYTQDGGNTWVERDDIYTLEPINSICFSDPQHGFMVGDEGAFMRTQNEGATWATKGFYNKPVSSISFADDVHGMGLLGQWIISGYAYYLIKTTDGGENWEILDLVNADKIFMHDSLQLTMITSYPYPCIIHSQDCGLSWDTIPIPGNSMSRYCGLFINPDTGWVVKSGNSEGTSILRTYNSGTDWEEFEMSSDDFYINSVFFFHSSENSEFGCAVGDNGYGGGLIFTTTDGGESWSLNDSWYGILNDVYFADNTFGWIAGGYEDSNSIILHTTDGGQTWETQDAGTDNGLNSVFFTSQETGWIAGNSGTILYTSNGGENWEICPYPGEESLYDVLFLDEQTGWIGGIGALLEYDGIWVKVANIIQPQSTLQLQVSPNPFNSYINIEYNLYETSDVKVTVYNCQGQQVIIFHVGIKSKGNHNIDFDASLLPSGVYFCRLQAGDRAAVKKIIKY